MGSQQNQADNSIGSTSCPKLLHLLPHNGKWKQFPQWTTIRQHCNFLKVFLNLQNNVQIIWFEESVSKNWSLWLFTIIFTMSFGNTFNMAALNLLNLFGLFDLALILLKTTSLTKCWHWGAGLYVGPQTRIMPYFYYFCQAILFQSPLNGVSD